MSSSIPVSKEGAFTCRYVTDRQYTLHVNITFMPLTKSQVNVRSRFNLIDSKVFSRKNP